jgi:hypothetical protein
MMRMMMKVSIPVDTGNAAMRDGSFGTKIQQLLTELKPEAAYFVEEDGLRTAILFFEMKDSSELPGVAEPWFLTFNASISVRPAMTAADLANAKPGIDHAVGGSSRHWA